MLADDIATPEAITPTDLWRRYLDAVADAAHAAGSDAVGEVTDLDPAGVADLVDGEFEAEAEAFDLSLADAAAVLALTDGSDPERELEAVHDRLLFDMSTAILDVDALAADLALDLDPQEIQRRVEGREPMTLEEYAHIRLRIARGLG